MSSTPKYEFGDKHAMLYCYDDRIVLTTHRGGMFSTIDYGEKERTIMIKDISSVVYSPSITGMSLFRMKNAVGPYIQFHVKGSSEKDPSQILHEEFGVQHGFGNLIDYGCMMLYGSDAKYYAAKVRDYVESRIAELANEANTPNIHVQTSTSIADEIIKLKKLLDDKVITEEEFNEAKKALLQK